MSTTGQATLGDNLVAYHEAGSGAPLIFVHGWASDRTFFAPQLTHFEAEYRTIGVDLRGHGESSTPPPAPGTYTVESFADDVMAVAKDAAADSPVVIGHSLGGLVALECARRGIARAAILLDPAPIFNDEFKSLVRGAAAQIAGDSDGAFRREFAATMFGPNDTVRRAEIIASMSAGPADVSAATLSAIAEYDGITALREVAVPLALIGSATAVDAIAELHAVKPGLEIGRTVGAGHFLQLEVPDQVNAMITRFLASC